MTVGVVVPSPRVGVHGSSGPEVWSCESWRAGAHSNIAAGYPLTSHHKRRTCCRPNYYLGSQIAIIVTVGISYRR